jgi:hypothetical protein
MSTFSFDPVTILRMPRIRDRLTPRKEPPRCSLA